MKLLLIGDPHLQISRFNESIDLLRWISDLVKEYKPDAVVNLGDSFHNHSTLRSEIMYEFKKHVEECIKTCPYIYVIGNHDCYRPNDSKYHALQPFDIPNLTVVDKVTDIGDITFVPYIHDFTQFPKETKRICIAHQTLVGADYGYYRPDVGVDADRCSAEIIISGHVHKRQNFGKVYYPGTPAAHDLNDIDQVKGVDLFDTATYEFTFIKSPFPGYKSLTYNVHSEFSAEDMHEDIVKSVNNKDYWIVKVKGPKPEIVAYMKSKKWLNLQKKVSIRIKPEFISGDKVERVKIKSVNINDVVSEYIDSVYDGSLDKNMLKLLSSRFINKSTKSSV